MAYVMALITWQGVLRLSPVQGVAVAGHAPPPPSV
jgi:hypothetical protein